MTFHPVTAKCSLNRTLFFLFYFNRLFATLISYAVRAYTWHKYRVYVDIQALQISLLGGRVFFKGVRYHGDNETILVHDGYITWQYWLRRVKTVDCGSRKHRSGSPTSASDSLGKEDSPSRRANGGEKGGTTGFDGLPCRILIIARGLEWFVYNRTPAYDNILNNTPGLRETTRPANNDNRAQNVSHAESSRSHKEMSEKADGYEIRSPTSLNPKSPDGSDGKTNLEGSQPMSTRSLGPMPDIQQAGEDYTLPRILKLLPMQVECSKGAIVMGNENTRSILVTKFESAVGQFDANTCRSVDRYKQTINLEVTHPVVQLKPNNDFREFQLSAGLRDGRVDGENSTKDRAHHHWDYHQRKRKLWHSMRELVPYFQSSVDSLGGQETTRSARGAGLPTSGTGVLGQDRWLGLTRYLDDDDEQMEQERWKAIEYGKFSTIVDSPSIGLSYYWDVPGLVSQRSENGVRPYPTFRDDINGDVPPEYGIDLRVRGGDINYGPWADRQRADLQTVFFPSVYQDATPASPLQPGQTRVSTVFKIFVEIEQETTLRIPTREDSKDWKWKGRHGTTSESDAKRKEKKKFSRIKKGDKALPSADVRPFGWLDVKVLRDSTVNYSMDMVAGETGFSNRLELDLRGPEMSSSANHDLLWRSQSQNISCDLSFPLGWNAPRKWKFDVHSDGLDLFILRDHIFLLTDLVGDWASGPPGDFYTFTPFYYAINLRFADFRLYLNANDSNIINKPSNVDDNTFIVIWGEELVAAVGIPLDTYRPARNKVTFEADARDGGFELRTPPWNTQHTFLQSSAVASMKDLRLDGYYNYYTATSPALTDTVLLNIYGATPTVHLHGFLVRYFMKLKDNYFGEDLHFHTLEEYQEHIVGLRDGDDAPTSEVHHGRLSNDLDVILAVNATDASAMLPANLYSASENIRIDISSIEADLRFTNYYMDLETTFSPLTLCRGSPAKQSENGSDQDSNTQVFVDGARINGHRLFGLPPTEPTYVCNWDFTVGSITGECSSDFLQDLSIALRCFTFSFSDDENALPLLHPTALHDVTFLRATVLPIRVWLHVGQAAFLFSTEELKVDFNDWAGSLFSERLHLFVPALTLATVDARTANRHRGRDHPAVVTHAYVQTTVDVRMVQRKRRFLNDRQLQQEHLSLHDQRTSRTPWLVHKSESPPITQSSNHQSKIKRPAMPYPPIPEPVSFPTTSDVSMSVSSRSSQSRTTAGSSKSSFLSTSSPRHKRRSAHRSSSSRVALVGSDDVRCLNRPESATCSAKIVDSRRPDAIIPSTRQMSFHSLPIDQGRAKQGLPPSSITFSSPYTMPYFPLHMVDPDLEEVPQILVEANDQRNLTDKDGYGGEWTSNSDESSVHTSFIIRLASGVTAYCTPNAFYSVVELLSLLQPRDPVSALDTLQMDVLTEVFALARNIGKPGGSSEINLQIPCIHLRIKNTHRHDPGALLEQDFYDMMAQKIAITARTTTRPQSERETRLDDQSSLHVSLDHLGIAARERQEGSLNSQASIHADLYDLVAWLVSGQISSGSVQFKEVQMVSTSRKVEYLAVLVHRTTTVIEDLVRRFLYVVEQERRRRQYLMLLLTTAGIDTPDPPCLTGASYVLRSITDHPRTSDSWKMMTRLRFVFQYMSRAEQDKILQQCFTGSRRCPDDAGTRVVASFDQWRTWDLAHAKKSLLVQKVYGSLAENSDSKIGKAGVVNAAIKAGRIRLIIDPGPKQNEIAFDTIIVGVALNQPLMAREIQISSSAKTSMIQIHCLKTATRLNWELCELVEDILRLFNESPIKLNTEGNEALANRPANREEHHLHVVVASETNILSLNTINMKLVSLSKSLKTSFVMSGHQDNLSGIAANFLLSADAVNTEVLSRSKLLTMHKLMRPSSYIFVDSKATEGAITRTWKAACSSQSLSFEIREDLLVLLESIDLVLGDEVAYICKLSQSFRPSAADTPVGTDATSRATVNRIYTALFLNAYSISLALLPSLSYVISGSIARASLAKKDDTQMLVDLDLKEHSHAFMARTNETKQEISSLRMPPINGRVVTSSAAGQLSMVLYIAIERIMFDAAAVHAILSTINRSEIVTLFRTASKDFESIKSHGQVIFSGRTNVPERTTTQSQLPVLYNGQITLAGLDVLATTPALQPNASSAQLKFDLGLVRMKITNKSSESGSRLEFVECDLLMREMKLDLERTDGPDVHPCGDVTFGVVFKATSRCNVAGELVRSYQARSSGLEINLFSETASIGVNILGQLQDRMKALDFSREIESLRRLGRWKPRLDVSGSEIEIPDSQKNDDAVSTSLFRSMYSLEMTNTQISWNIGEPTHLSPAREPEDLVLSFKKIDLSTRKENAARLIIEDFQLQMVPTSRSKKDRSLNSALLPEVVFNVAHLSTARDRRLAFQAAGKSLDLRLTSQFILPASDLQRSIALASGNLRAATASWDASPTQNGAPRRTLFGDKKLASFLVDADFAGAVVYIQGRKVSDLQSEAMSILRRSRPPQHGRYGQFTHEDASSSTTLRAPGIALKIQYMDMNDKDPSLSAEIKVASSSNVLYPTVVPLVMDISSCVKEVVGEPDETEPAEPVSEPKPPQTKFLDEGTLRTADPSAILGKCRLNLGLRICKQEFTLSCQPIARVAANARFEDIYITVSTVQSAEQGRFFAVSAAFSRLQMSVQHVYSRESTGTFDIQSIVLSLINSRHVSAADGLSVMLKISPMKATINAKQLQDFLLFREIWVPSEIRHSVPTRTPSPSSEPQAFMVQRYQQVASAGAFPWNATISITELDVSLDLGQGLGKSTFVISNFWVSSKKSSDWEQNLCSGFDKVSIKSSGRMSGFVELQNLRLRTSIEWPERERARNRTPLIQASLGFDHLRVKAAFDYQAFLVADIEFFEFLMYNVREARQAGGDRLVGLLDGDKVQVFCTTASASQGVALYQAIQRLVQEKQLAYEASLRDIEKFLRRRSTVNPIAMRAAAKEVPLVDEKGSKIPIQLHTDVVVTLKAVRLGAFPSTFFDNQIFKLEALDASARFAVALEKGRIHSGLGLTLGQLRIALAAVSSPNVPKTLGDVSIDDVVSYATGASGGTILKVPKVVATMRTWQSPESTAIDYIFKSSFEGKVDVGWNYSRISFIRGMWTTHSRALAHRLGKPLPQSAVQIRGGPRPEGEDGAEGAAADPKSDKITAVVNVPQSKYQYTALEPAIIETPQLRDMGEATPPLEWIGLHRDRLPNLTHQIVIVTLLEVAKEVEDAYSKILGSS